MKNKLQKVIAIITIMAVVAWIVPLHVSSTKVEPPIEQTEKQVKPLVITTTPRNRIGTLTIRGENDDIYYQYQGEIDVASSGWNGDDVVINIDLPSTYCSCFDENKIIEQN